MVFEYTTNELTRKQGQNSQGLKMKRRLKIKTGQLKLMLLLIWGCLPLSYKKAWIWKSKCRIAYMTLGPFKVGGGIKTHHIRQPEGTLWKSGLGKPSHQQWKKLRKFVCLALLCGKKPSLIIQNHRPTLIGVLKETLSWEISLKWSKAWHKHQFPLQGHMQTPTDGVPFLKCKLTI